MAEGSGARLGVRGYLPSYIAAREATMASKAISASTIGPMSWSLAGMACRPIGGLSRAAPGGSPARYSLAGRAPRPGGEGIAGFSLPYRYIGKPAAAH